MDRANGGYIDYVGACGPDFASFTVESPGASCSGNLVPNGGFESGDARGWVAEPEMSMLQVRAWAPGMCIACSVKVGCTLSTARSCISASHGIYAERWCPLLLTCRLSFHHTCSVQVSRSGSAEGRHHLRIPGDLREDDSFAPFVFVRRSCLTPGTRYRLSARVQMLDPAGDVPQFIASQVRLPGVVCVILPTVCLAHSCTSTKGLVSSLPLIQTT